MTEGVRKIYTRFGDKGQTRLLSGEAVAKDDLRVDTYGALDELQSHLGMARTLLGAASLRSMVHAVQRDLFVAGAELASTEEKRSLLKQRITHENISVLEVTIDRLTESFGLPASFVIPGDSADSAALHVARTVCRRLERLIVQLNRRTGGYSSLVVYFNRLSDLLFVMAWSAAVWAVAEDALMEKPPLFPFPSDREGERLAKVKQSMKIPYPVARLLGSIAEAAAVRLGVPMAIALADGEGGPQFFLRMDGALPASTEIAMAKAYTAAALRISTEALGRLALPGKELYGIQHTHGGKIILFGGGIPLESKEMVVGAVGISGGTVEEDIGVATAAVQAFERMAEWSEEIVPLLGATRKMRPSSRELEMHLWKAVQRDGSLLPPELSSLLVGASLLAVERA